MLKQPFATKTVRILLIFVSISILWTSGPICAAQEKDDDFISIFSDDFSTDKGWSFSHPDDFFRNTYENVLSWHINRRSCLQLIE